MFEQIAQYKILDRIPAASREEYRARDTRAGRTVRIVLLPDAVTADADRRGELFDVARVRTALSHPNIVALYEIGEADGRVFLALEFVAGESLKAAMGARPMNVRRALDLASQIADALAEAHARGIVDRRISAETIVITPAGRAKIVELGSTSWLEARAAGPGVDADAAGGDDVRSIGALLFEMLTGTAPLEAPPRLLNPALSREVDRIVRKALADRAEDRYASAATLAADLRSAIEELDARRAAAERATKR